LVDFEARLASSERSKLFTGKAFIIFEKPADAESILLQSKKTVIRKIFRYIQRKLCCCCEEKNIDFAVFEKAPEPNDVYWEHLDVTDF
jgi:hypothetical protein